MKSCLPRSAVKKNYQGITDTTILRKTDNFIKTLQADILRGLKANELVSDTKRPKTEKG